MRFTSSVLSKLHWLLVVKLHDPTINFRSANRNFEWTIPRFSLTRSEAVQGVLLHQFLLTQLASGVTTNERISLIKLEGGDAQARGGGIREEWD